jgi:hypothetical protein
MVEQRKEFLWEDGRRAEKIVVDDNECDGVRVTEVYVEPAVEKKLAQRVIERRKPVVYEREIETIDESTGEVVEKVVEGHEPRAQMHVIERYMPETVGAQSVVHDHKDDDCDCNVSREELREDIKDAVLALAKVVGKNGNGNGNGHGHVHHAHEGHGYHAQAVAEPAPQVSVQSVLEERLETKKSKVSPLNVLLLAVISAQVAGLAWILFVM